MDAGSSVTLIFYSVDQNNIANEPFLNIVAAIAQGSSLTHVEMAIVSTHGRSNTANACRAGLTASLRRVHATLLLRRARLRAPVARWQTC